MGRPIKARYFVKPGPKDPGVAITGQGVTVSINANGTHYSTGATAAFSAPQLTGQQATLTLTVNTTTGAISAATIANPGSGYTTAPTVTVTTATGVSIAATGTSGASTVYVAATTGIYVGMKVLGTGINAGATYVTNVNTQFVNVSAANASTVTGVVSFVDTGAGATFTVGLTQAELDTGTIATTAYIPGGSSAVSSAIIKQEASHSYLIENAQGHGRCKLATTSTLVAGQMYILAQDANGSQYYVTKLTARKARLVQKTVSGSYVYANGSVARWSPGFSSASGTNPLVSGTKVGVQTY